jgi:hypothetical protein
MPIPTSPSIGRKVDHSMLAEVATWREAPCVPLLARRQRLTTREPATSSTTLGPDHDSCTRYRGMDTDDSITIPGWTFI